MSTIAPRHLGRLGEHYALYKLESFGIEAFRVDREDVDIWAKLPNKKLISVQVKSSRRFVEKNRRTHYRFYFKKQGSKYVPADLAVLVGVDNENLNAICLRDKFGSTGYCRLNERFFCSEFEKKSFNRMLKNKTMKFINQDTLQ